MDEAGTELKVTQHRIIFLSSVLNKWYMSCVIALADLTPFPSRWRLVPVAGISGIGVEFVTLNLKLLCEKAYEWGDCAGVIINADVETAYDCLHPSETLITLEQWGVHPMVSAAIMKEAIGLTGKGEFEGIPFSTGLSRAVRQGTIEA